MSETATHPLTHSLWLHERSWVGVQENLKTNDTVLIPVGAVEQHGAHTPLMVDMCWATAMAEGIARATGAIIAPPVYGAFSSGHFAYPGAITIRPEVLTDYLVDVARSLMLSGYKRFVLINGNRVANLPPMVNAALKIRMTYGAWSGVLDAALTTFKETAEIVGMAGMEHAGDAETSFMLRYRPDLVDMGRTGTQPPCPGDADYAAAIQEFPVFVPMLGRAKTHAETKREHAHMQTAGLATLDKGTRILDLLVARSVEYVRAQQDKPVTLRNLDVPM